MIDHTDALKRPLAETDASGNVTRFYVWCGSQLLCHIEANGTVRYYHADELGSTLALTDATGNVTDQFAYMPYGDATHTGSTSTPFQWLGGYGVYYDSDTDLHLTLHRAYSAKIKRFIHPDPLGIDGGVNVYVYANQNPLFFVDPTGEIPVWLITGGIGAQFTSEAFTNVLLSKGIRISMDGRGRALDNVYIERLWWTVKYEEVYPKCYDYYNEERKHSAIDKQTPSDVFMKGLTGTVEAMPSLRSALDPTDRPFGDGLRSATALKEGGSLAATGTKMEPQVPLKNGRSVV